MSVIINSSRKLVFERLSVRYLGRNESWFILIAALHFIFWTAAPSLGFSSPPLVGGPVLWKSQAHISLGLAAGNLGLGLFLDNIHWALAGA